MLKHGSLLLQSSHDYHGNGLIVLNDAVIFQLTTTIKVPDPPLWSERAPKVSRGYSEEESVGAPIVVYTGDMKCSRKPQA